MGRGRDWLSTHVDCRPIMGCADYVARSKSNSKDAPLTCFKLILKMDTTISPAKAGHWFISK